jgi:hypothetical protein
MMTLDLQTVAQVTQRLERLITAPLEPAYQFLRQEGNMIIQQANLLVPVDTGLLRSTGGVDTGALETPRRPGGVVEVTLRYGAHGVAPYAAIVHNDSQMRHPHGGQAFFLQLPLFASTAGLLPRAATALQGALQ